MKKNASYRSELESSTPLLEEAKRGEFEPLSEKEMLIELKTFIGHVTCGCSFITHHIISGVEVTEVEVNPNEPEDYVNGDVRSTKCLFRFFNIVPWLT